MDLRGSCFTGHVAGVIPFCLPVWMSGFVDYLSSLPSNVDLCPSVGCVPQALPRAGVLVTDFVLLSPFTSLHSSASAWLRHP